MKVTVKEILKKYLNDNGFDGLYYPGECACKKDDLAPCDNLNMGCKPGYLQECKAGNENCEFDWCIAEKKNSKCDDNGGYG